MKAEAIAEPGNLKRSIPGVPPRPRPGVSLESTDSAPVPAVFQAKVVVGNYTTMREAKLISDALLSYNFDPTLKEIGGSYTLQIGSFSDINRARSLVQELKSHNFDARIVYE
jgi:cell division septation protein DedD